MFPAAIFSRYQNHLASVTGLKASAVQNCIIIRSLVSLGEKTREGLGLKTRPAAAGCSVMRRDDPCTHAKPYTIGNYLTIVPEGFTGFLPKAGTPDCCAPDDAGPGIARLGTECSEISTEDVDQFSWVRFFIGFRRNWN